MAGQATADGLAPGADERFGTTGRQLAAMVRRFPLAVVGVVVGTLVATAHAAMGAPDDTVLAALLPRLFLGCFALVCWDAATRLAAERLVLAQARQWGLKLAGLVVSLPAILPLTTGLEILALALALFLLIIIGAGPGRAADDPAFWDANAGLAVRMGIAFFLAALLFGGVMLLLAGIDILLEINIDRLPLVAFVLCACAFAPVVTMTNLPTLREMRPAGAELRLLTFTGVAIAVPLCTAYLVLVYAQVVRFLIVGEVPANSAGWFVSLFGTVGIVTWMATAAPEAGQWAHVRLYRRLFFPALIIPALVLAWSVQQRVAAFGWTPERVALALVNGWFALSILWWLGRGLTGRGMRVLPVLLACLAVLGAIGPLSMSALTTRSQTERLERMLTDAGLLVTGRVGDATDALDTEQRQELSSILEALSRVRSADAPLPWTLADGAAGPVTLAGLAARLDLSTPLAADEREDRGVTITRLAATGLALPPGAALLWEVEVRGDEVFSLPAGAGIGPVSIRLADGRLEIELGDGWRSVDLPTLAGTGTAEPPTDVPWPGLPAHNLDLAGPAARMQVHPLFIGWTRGDDGSTAITNATMTLILSPPTP